MLSVKVERAQARKVDVPFTPEGKEEMGMHATFLQAAFPQQWKRKHFKMVKLLSNKVMLLLKEELG